MQRWQQFSQGKTTMASGDLLLLVPGGSRLPFYLLFPIQLELYATEHPGAVV